MKFDPASVGRPVLVAVLCATLVAGGGTPARRRLPRAAPRSTTPMPFAVGERLTYDAKLNFLRAGSATMIVQDVEEVRGRASYHTIFDVRGKLLFFHVNDHYESWFDTTTLTSLRHIQQIDEGNYDRARHYEFYPELKVYVRNGVQQPSVADPLDEGSFIYFMRSIPLELGRTYEFNRYYHPDRNPVIVSVVRRERISVPAGDFDAIVLKPVIKSRGLFAETGHAEVWYSDDAARLLLRLKSKLSFGTLYLELRTVENTPPR
jgi:Protein of unknown function (DUF3108)